jgi:hypothetical protein
MYRPLYTTSMHIMVFKSFIAAHVFMRTTKEHAGRLDMSAVTEHEIPKLVKAPLIIPHGKYRSMLVVWAALSPSVAESLSVASMLSTDGSIETRVSHRKRLS